MKACVFTIGCKMNEVESASLRRGLEALGYETTDELSYADLYLLNTCAVTAEAERKSRQAVARLRKFNPDAPVVVCGCASQHSPEAFSGKEGVYLVAGAMQKDKILEMLKSGGILRGTDRAFCELPLPKQSRTRAYLRVQDGCDRFCSYCLIPYLRGRSRSRALPSILKEAEEVSAREIVLTGIDLSAYRDGDCGLGDLLTALKGVPARIRLGSLEASIITPAFLEKARAAGNVAPHFHLSLQSGSDRVLRAMNRHYTREEFLRACRLVYEYFPDAAITTDIIVGFPTEEEEDFQDTLSLCGEAGFAQIHAFPFSAREGTNAAKLKDLPASVKRERMARMLFSAEQLHERYISRFLGSVRPALFEEDGGYTDNYIRVTNSSANEGTMYEVRLVKSQKNGVQAELIKEI